MTYFKIPLAVLATLLISACHSSKKSKGTASAAPAPSAPTAAARPSFSTTPVTTGPAFPPPVSKEIYEPRNEELVALQARYKDVTLETLKEGHAIYTKGACVNCHAAQSIYKYNDVHWKEIMDDMAEKARLTEAQKDAVYKYVLAIKATQPKSSNSD